MCPGARSLLVKLLIIDLGRMKHQWDVPRSHAETYICPPIYNFQPPKQDMSCLFS